MGRDGIVYDDSTPHGHGQIHITTTKWAPENQLRRGGAITQLKKGVKKKTVKAIYFRPFIRGPITLVTIRPCTEQ